MDEHPSVEGAPYGDLVDLLYARWLDELWSGPLDDLERIAAEVVGADFVGSWPGRPAMVRGPDELAATIREGRTMFAELTFEREVGPVGDGREGGLIAARWVGRGVLDGGAVEFHGHDLLRHRDGRFVEYWVLSEDPAPAG